MNLVLSFIHPTKPTREIGPFQSVRMDAETVREGTGGEVIARHRQHQWEVQGERYSRLDASARVRIHFERARVLRDAADKSRSFGPYERFSAVDGIAYTDDRVFAFVDARVGDWFCYEDGRHWALMIVSDATPRNQNDLWTLLIGLAPSLPGVIGLWQDFRLVYLGRAASIRSRLENLADGLDANLFTALTWESHCDPAAREAELHAEYANASASLEVTYGSIHGGQVRTHRLIEHARQARERARTIRAAARCIRQALPLAERARERPTGS